MWLSTLLNKTFPSFLASTCARDRRALQQLALNVHIKHSDLTQLTANKKCVKYDINFFFNYSNRVVLQDNTSLAFSFQPVLHDWCNKGRGMCYPVCGMVHIKEPLLRIGKSSPCGGSGFPLSLSEWSFTTCLTPYNRKIKMC